MVCCRKRSTEISAFLDAAVPQEKSQTYTSRNKGTVKILSRETMERELDAKCLFNSFLLKFLYFVYIHLYHTGKSRIPAKLYLFSGCVVRERL